MLLACQQRSCADPARRLRLPARYRSQHHPGHPLCRREQFRRPAARGLRRRRMRGEAGGRIGAARASSRNSRRQNLSLKMFDCYRPVRAVADMVAWSQNGKETAGRAALQSGLPQGGPVPARLYRHPFRHSTGAALDLTLVDLEGRQFGALRSRQEPMPTAPRRRKRARRRAASTWAPAMIVPTSRRTPRRSLDHAGAARWRNMLVAAMARQGFVNYSKEWWHFSLPGAGGPAYDFPIQARRN